MGRTTRKGVESADDLTEVQSASPFESTAAATPAPAVVTAVSLPAAPPSPETELAPGTILGEYSIERKLGRGGMGDVYLGVHRVIRKRAAIKLLRGDACSDETAVGRFIAEARVVNEIGHPNIVDVFAFGQASDGRHFLAMEWLQGETLRERIARGALPLEEAAEITKPLVRALLAAHTKGVVHRDLKPDNVFLQAHADAPRTVKLLDFGIAKLMREPSQQQTQSGVLVGTPMYMAPEQARGERVDASTDVYALGGMLFEMLTGRPPFLATTAYEVVAKHLTEAPPQVSAFVPVGRELDAEITAMLAKEPAQRPSLAHVLAVLERVGERESLGSIAVTAVRNATPAPRPRRVVALLAGVAVAGGVAGYAVLHAMKREPAPIVAAPIEIDAAVPIDAAPPPDAPIDAAIVIDAAVPTVPAVEPPPPQRPRTTRRPATQPKTKPATTPTTPSDDEDRTLYRPGSVKK